MTQVVYVVMDYLGPSPDPAVPVAVYYSKIEATKNLGPAQFIHNHPVEVFLPPDLELRRVNVAKEIDPDC